MGGGTGGFHRVYGIYLRINFGMQKFGWTIITTEGSDKMLQKRAIKAGYKTFLPQERSFTFHRGQKTEKLTPLFPGYLFVDVRGHWRKLLEVQGVEGFLMSYADNAEDNR